MRTQKPSHAFSQIVRIVPSTAETATRCCSVPRNPIAAPFSSRPACPGDDARWPEGEKVGSRPELRRSVSLPGRCYRWGRWFCCASPYSCFQRHQSLRL